MRAALGFAAVAALLAWSGPDRAAAGGFRAQPVAFGDLDGWAEDDHAAAFTTFRRSCAVPGSFEKALAAACRDARALGGTTAAAARAFFEAHFEAAEIIPEEGRGFLTGYFEPEYEGSLTPSETFSVPLLARPDDLVDRTDAAEPGFPAGLRAARRTGEGLAPYPVRAAIEDGALGATGRPIVYLRDPVEAFIVHVQGSARIRLPDGDVIRVGFAGRNGQPYTSIARVLSEREHIPPAELGLEKLTAWLRGHPVEARDLMRENKSYIFFRIVSELRGEDGPVGGAGLPLTAGRSLAVDHRIWGYGLPIWLEGEIRADESGATTKLHRLVVAQDTGSAIVGPARGDLFLGAGAEAGRAAGLLRDPVRFIVLRPGTAGSDKQGVVR